MKPSSLVVLFAGRRSALPAALLLFSAVLFASATNAWADIYMSAGKTIYDFNSSGVLVNQVDIDTLNYSAEGVKFGPDGRLYVGVAGGEARVDSFAPDLTGHVTGFVGSYQGGLVAPSGLTFGADGNLYVAGSNVDRYYGPSSVSPVPGSNNPSSGDPATTALWSSISGPVDVALAPDGTLYGSSVSGSTGTLYRFDSAGAGTIVADLESISYVGAVAIDAIGTSLFVRDNGQVLKYAIDSGHLLTRDLTFSVNYTPGLGSSLGLTFGPDGFLYATTRTQDGEIADFIVKIDPSSGNTTPFVTGDLNTLTSAQNPAFLVFSPSDVPEPATLTLLGSALLGFAGLVYLRRCRAKGSDQE